MYEWVNLLWVMPTLCALSIPLLSRVSKLLRDIAPALVCCATVATAVLLLRLPGRAPVSLKFDWVFLPGFGRVQFGLYIDTLSVVMSNVVAWISLVVFIYSLGYMEGDSSLDRYWFFMLLFLGGMELLVMSENLIQMLLGWEVVGVCSFALISYWYKDSKEERRVRWVGEPPEEYPPSHCGLKAFLVTRLADTFIVAGIITLSIMARTVSFAELLALDPGENRLLQATLALLFVGATGKSAQLPFTEWLPDAMAGPTSASALIHAATMVKAGVFLTARVVQIALAWGLGARSPSLFKFILWTGVLTAFAAALQAVVTSELKKTLAYSTMSQIGYMLACLGAASVTRELSLASSLFHLISHAIFKSALFLCAGVMIHTVGSRFYEDLKGIGRSMKALYVFFAVAALSLTGVPPLMGFWSKEAVLASIVKADTLAALLAIATAAITAFYTVRMLALTYGVGVKQTSRVHNSLKLTMLAPCAFLAAACLALGLLGSTFEELFYSAFSSAEPGNLAYTPFTLGAVAAGAALAALHYLRAFSFPGFLEPFRYVLKHRLYLNTAYYLVARGIASMGTCAGIFDSLYTKALLSSAAAANKFGEKLKVLQTGVLTHEELLWVVGGALILALLTIFR